MKKLQIGVQLPLNFSHIPTVEGRRKPPKLLAVLELDKTTNFKYSLSCCVSRRVRAVNETASKFCQARFSPKRGGERIFCEYQIRFFLVPDLPAYLRWK